MKRTTIWLVAAAFVLLPASVGAQGGGEVDYGDMVRILRDPLTARPILQKPFARDDLEKTLAALGG